MSKERLEYTYIYEYLQVKKHGEGVEEFRTPESNVSGVTEVRSHGAM